MYTYHTRRSIFYIFFFFCVLFFSFPFEELVRRFYRIPRQGTRKGSWLMSSGLASHMGSIIYGVHNEP